MFELTMKTDNAAFWTECGDLDTQEIASILRTIARKLEDGHESGVEQDINGNGVCPWSLKAGE